MTDQVKVIDGTDMGEVKKGHPSLDQGLLDEIEELELEDFDSEDPVKKEPKKEVAEADDEEVLDEELEVEESEEESKDESEEEKAEEEIEDSEEDNSEEYHEELEDVVSELKRAHEQVAFLSESLGARPEQPSKDEDDSPGEWQQYRMNLAAWTTSKSNLDAQAKFAKQKVNQLSSKEEDLFVAQHKGENLLGFKNWVADSLELQALFYTGKKNLESLYKMYKVDTGDDTTKRQVSEIKKKGGKFKAVNSKGGGRDIASSKYPKQYKYMNHPEFKDLAKQLLSAPNPFTGKKPSMKEVNDVIKSEYSFHKNRGKF